MDRRLRVLSWLLIVSGLSFGISQGSFWGLALVILGAAIRPLEQGQRMIWRRLDLQRLRSLSRTELEILEALFEHAGQRGLDEQSLLWYLEDCGPAELRAALAELLDAGLALQLGQAASDGEAALIYLPREQARQLVVEERERRQRLPRLGKRSRPSSLADRLT
jgi:hypothetical protein